MAACPQTPLSFHAPHYNMLLYLKLRSMRYYLTLSAFHSNILRVSTIGSVAVITAVQ